MTQRPARKSLVAACNHSIYLTYYINMLGSTSTVAGGVRVMLRSEQRVPRMEEMDMTTRRQRFLSMLFGGLLALPLAGGALRAQETAPPGGSFKMVSSLVPLPDFVPGLGTLYVDPSTLPAGPFLAYDRDGQLVSTIYMIPLDKLDGHQAFEGLGASDQPVDHVDVVFNAGHPGVPVPHYHVILWHISKKEAANLQ